MADEESLLELGELEAKFIANGKSYGYSKDALRSYVELRLADVEARRTRKEEQVKIKQELDDDTRRRESSNEYDAGDERARSSWRGPRLDIPKYYGSGKQSVVQYLELFEEIAEQCRFETSEWLLRLRIAVAGSKLERSCLGCRSYQEAKRELLVAHGSTPEKAWKMVTNTQQQPDESFHQFVTRVGRAVKLWSRLTTEDGESDEESMSGMSVTPLGAIQEALVKQVVLDASCAELRAFLLERKGYQLSLALFQDAGMSFQEAHGRKVKRPLPARGLAPVSATTQCMQIATHDMTRKITDMSLDERIRFAQMEKLCWNCLKVGHRANRCFSTMRCSTCGKKHNTLMHQPAAQAPSNVRTEDISLATYECGPASQVRLMTGVGRVQSSTKASRVRVFLDTGAQASFISGELVNAIKPELISKELVKVKAFGAEPVWEEMERYKVTIAGKTKPITITAWRKEKLDMEYDLIPAEEVARWQGKGVTLSDTPSGDVPKAVHLLIGADHCNDIIRSKSEIQGESVWNTEIGWILSGPVKMAQDVKSVSVHCVELERLWKMEEVPDTAGRLPDFPLERSADGYQVGLLWRTERRPPDNLPQAMATAQALLKKLERQGTRAAYDKVLLTEYRKLDAIEKEMKPDSPGYYLPHHAVFKHDSTTTKTRVVFNASASMEPGVSLNDLVDPGPSLLPDLAGLLLRLREYPCALQADIRKAFFMIGMREEDRPYLRFVWPEAEGEEMCIWRLKKLPFGVNCSPFILNAVLRCHLESVSESVSESESDIIKLLLRSFYVDDFITSVPKSSDAHNLQKCSVDILQGAGMELRKWRGNTIVCDAEAGTKVLGMVWDTDTDALSVAAVEEVNSSTGMFTRRVLLKCVASVFDPLGLVCPSVVRGKMLLQECWKLGGGWDDQLPDALSMQCAQWWGAMSDVSKVHLPRWVGCYDDSSVTLHVFADASEKAYGCCLYVVSGVLSSLLYAKAKVAPVSPPTIARLELQAVHLASKVLQFVVSQLRINVGRIVGWTDSLTTWHWLMSPSYKWKTYVANRVNAIQDVAKELDVEWRHVPGVSNPADLASRGVPPGELTEFWKQGPEWLVREEQWPEPKSLGSTLEAVAEARVSAVQVEAETPINWKWERFSEWRRARGVVLRILTLIHKEKTRAELYPLAEAVMYRRIQAECFPEELSALKAGQPLLKNSKLCKMAPFLDQAGVLRVGGQLQESPLPYESQHPVLLGKHHLTTLLLEYVHRQRMHQGVEGVLAHVRSQWWIVGVRRQLRNITERCVTCRWFRAQAATESTAPLPEDRATFSKPFGLTGVDHAGPLFVRTENGEKKVWITLFVCGSTRAVHIEVVSSLSTDAFLLAFRRFVARRGMPSRVRSDNATTFKSASEKIDVVWVFNPPAAPWHGGFYERLVGAVKSPLKKVLGKASLYLDELVTVLVEIEGLVNSRPLTCVSTDLNDEAPLTPAMMLGEVFSSEIPANDQSLSVVQLNARFKYVQQVQQHLKQRWYAEYLTSLRHHHQSKSAPVKAGDVVLVADNQKKRHLWRMGRIVEVYPGKDGKCRVARVRVGQSTMLRAFQCLVPLEVRPREDSPVCPSVVVPIADPVASDDTVSSALAKVGDVSRRSARTVKPITRLNL